MRKKFFLVFLLASSVAAFGGVCPMIVGEGRGKNREMADNKADIAIAQSIYSSLASVSHDTLFSKVFDGVPDDYNGFSEITKMKTFLPNRQDVRQLKPHYEEGGEIVSVRYICRSDAAKPYLERQRILTDEMEMTKDWHKIKTSWNEFQSIQLLLAGLQVESKYLAKAGKIYDNFKDLCNAKLHWKPEKKTDYSEIAYQKLRDVGIESPPCLGKSIMLVYSGEEPECKSNGGPWACTYQPSLRITSCIGKQVDLLPNPAPIKSYGEEKRNALDRMKNKLRTADFWNDWEQKIEQWSPQCE